MENAIQPEAISRNKKMEEKIESFIQQFQFNIATKQVEKEALRRLRHQVFIEELDYKLNTDEKKKIEYDQFDDSSIHCFITHNRTGLVAGCLRLVMPMKKRGMRPSLPLEDYCTTLFNHPLYKPHHFHHEETCEVSRFAIPKTFRNKNRHYSINGKKFEFHNEETELFPMIMIGLFLSTFALVGLTARPHVFASMQPNLPRALSFSGFYFTRITEIFEHFGTRAGFYINHERAKNEFKKELSPLYQHIKNQLRHNLPADLLSADYRQHEEIS